VNLVDLALALLLVVCAVRGFWRGLIRESFGFAAFLIGIFSALRLTGGLAESLEGWSVVAGLPDTALVGGVFVAVFLATSAAINLAGFVIDRLLGFGVLRQLGRVGGGLFGAAKGGAVLAFVLLFLHLFPVVGGLEDRLADSRLAQPMISLADGLLRGNWVATGTAGESA
jgi:membrane protein required for colicin V production